MSSCEEEYHIDAGDFESKLVVNSLFNHEIPWSVHVSNSVNILDASTDIENVANARVEIYNHKGEFIYELFHEGDGNYRRDGHFPSEKGGYQIKVSAPGYKTVTAESFVPVKSTLSINNFSIIQNEKYEDLEVDFEIEDRSDLESYYIWEIVSINNDTGDGDGEAGNLSDAWIDDLTNNPSDLVGGSSREILGGGSFGDGKYNGTYNSADGNRRVKINDLPDPKVNYVHEIQYLSKLDPNINLPGEISPNDDPDNEYVDGDEGGKVEYKYELRVMSISAELYQYYSSVEEYLNSHENNNHSNQVPYDIYTNVTNGLGIFAGFSESVIQF